MAGILGLLPKTDKWWLCVGLCVCLCMSLQFCILKWSFLYIQILSCIGFVKKKKKAVYISIKVVKATVVLLGTFRGVFEFNLIRPNLIPKNMYQ